MYIDAELSAFVIVIRSHFAHLPQGTNTLTVQFEPPANAAKVAAANRSITPPECPPPRYNGECHANQLRKMQASFGWDWGLAAPSMGLWKLVVLELYQVARVRDVTYQLKPNQTHWTVLVAMHLEAGTEPNRPVDGVLRLDMPTLLEQPLQWPVKATGGIDGELMVRRTFAVELRRVAVWWTNGLGEQPLYELQVQWETSTMEVESNAIRQQTMEYFRSEKVIRVGFRTVELVENDVGGYFEDVGK